MDLTRSLCILKPDCCNAERLERLIHKYGGDRVPRYTSYPTVAQFDGRVGQREYRAWLSQVLPHEQVSLYIHIPFCRSLCWYCGCNTGVARKPEVIESYIETLCSEIALVAQHAGRLRVDALHLGGGSPNSLSVGQLHRLHECLKAHFEMPPGIDMAVELDPRFLSEEWVAAAAELGVNRASLGIQDFGPEVQSAINRQQSFQQTAQACEALRWSMIQYVNFDLVYGLPRQTTAGLLETLRQAISLKPDRIALFAYAHVPWMMPRQKLIADHDLPDAEERFEQQLSAAHVLRNAGYCQIGLDHFAQPLDRLAVAARHGLLCRNFQGYTDDPGDTLIGLGASAISQFAGGYVQNAVSTPEWRVLVECGELASVRGVRITEADRLRGAIIERLMCDLKVDLREMGYGCAAVAQEFRSAYYRLIPMQEDGLVDLAGGQISVTELGRPFLRTICSAFDVHLQPGAGLTRHAKAS